ncbi:MAG: ABC transporter permease [Candidatus Marinimicrobia bacterium]|jgi:heme exporter protein B|nr:ABC transporter permease [Candidatus Neomarinimicrobiota bacterium]MBT3618428.1 ABC transporter permease [Candidatus Neomarinimicrobiota bacterium]MBT3829016.1 ABC transporter permease [Candidatus Neomarinimicrobiota bacterium]MBT3997941.1 ABC transporter permease [Candidatus Neomarinimicrobiota bacterium]MBT4280023.1 ABC transporter permease [Candidatus Neomarinimicrobiota bacterium]
MLAFLVKKELLMEFRAKESFLTMAAFSMVVIVSFSFSFNVSSGRFVEMTPGLFWVMVLFTSVLGLQRSFAYESEFDAFSMLLSAPVDRGLIFLAKWISGWIVLTLIVLIALIPFTLFLRFTIPTNPLVGIGIILLGNASIMCLGSFVSGLAMRSRLSNVLVPILLFPLLSPVVIASVKSTSGWMRGLSFSTWETWIFVLSSFIIIFGLLGYTLFNHITEE